MYLLYTTVLTCVISVNSNVSRVVWIIVAHTIAFHYKWTVFCVRSSRNYIVTVRNSSETKLNCTFRGNLYPEKLEHPSYKLITVDCLKQGARTLRTMVAFSKDKCLDQKQAPVCKVSMHLSRTLRKNRQKCMVGWMSRMSFTSVCSIHVVFITR